MAPPTSFNPDAATHLALLNDWMDCAIDLRTLAANYNTTPAELCFFFARPEIAAQLSLIHAAAYNRARLAATTHLDSALSAIALIVRRFLADQANPDPTLTPDQQRRSDETGRRAATILLRFIKNRPAGFSRSPGTPTLRVGSSPTGGPPVPGGSDASASYSPQPDEPLTTERAQPPAAPNPSPCLSPPSSPPSSLPSNPPQRTPAQPPRTSACAPSPISSPISTTELAHAALQALAEMRLAELRSSAPTHEAQPAPTPHPTSTAPPPTTPNPPSEVLKPISQPIPDFLQPHLIPPITPPLRAPPLAPPAAAAEHRR